MSDKEDLRVVRTRKLLSNTLIEMMEVQSIEKISVIDLCDKAMVNRATFYAHFEDKYHLLAFALEELKDELYAQFTKVTGRMRTPKEAVRSLLQMAVDFFFSNHKHILNIIRCNRNNKLISTIEDSIAQSVRYQLSKFRDTYEIKVPLSVISNFISGGILNTALHCIDNPGKHTYEEFYGYTAIFADNSIFVKKQLNQ